MPLSDNYNVRGLALNKPQIRSSLTFADIGINVWSRGTGKTFDIANDMIKLGENLPRAAVAFTARTLDQMVSITLPEVANALEMLGYHEWDGKRGDYIIAKRPPEHWPKPYARKLKFEKCITWRTGTTFVLVSQQNKGSGRGFSIDAIRGDEALMLKHDQLKQELVTANRGNLHRFPDNPYHHSQKYWTSKPYVGMGKWIDSYADYYQEEFGIDIFTRNNAGAALMLQFIDSEDRKERDELWQEIRQFLIEDPYRVYTPKDPNKPSIFYNEAVVFDNLQNLGWAYIMGLREELTDFMFKVEVLNMSVNGVENNFYHVTEDLLYDPPSYYESHGIHLYNSATVTPYHRDTDVVRTEPLDFACDANFGINSMVVGQLVGEEYGILNALFVKKGKLINDLAQLFCDYYKHHPKKHARFFYDQTFLGVDAGRPKSFKQMIVEVLVQNGWTVEEHFIGAQPSHHSRYESINQFLLGQQPITIQLNRQRAKDLYTALESTAVRVSSTKEFKKDKRPETTKSPTVKQEHTTHLTDAFDTLLIGRLLQHPTVQHITTNEFHQLTSL